MSATIAQGGGTVQAVQSDMRLALKHGQNGHRRVFTRCNRGNTIPDEEISHQSPWRKEVGSWVYCTWKGESCGGKILGYGLRQSHGWLPWLPKWRGRQSTDKLGPQRNVSTSPWPTQTSDTTSDAASAHTASCTTRQQLGRTTFPNW